MKSVVFIASLGAALLTVSAKNKYEDMAEQLAALNERQTLLEINSEALEIKCNTFGRKLSENTTEVTTTYMATNNSEQVMTDALADVKVCLDHMWLLVCGALVMFMQAGFAILESGTCRAKNANMIMLKNACDVCVGTIVWYIFGYGFAYGLESEEPNEFIGTTNFAGSKFDGTNHYRDWFFQWAFCATAATIVSGGVAERVNFVAYSVYSIIMTGLIYPIIVYWTWSGEGFLTNNGYVDFAGSGIVHLTGGVGALVGAAIIGARIDRFDDSVTKEDKEKFNPHNMALVMLGTFILWFGWYGFNCGSTLAFSDRDTAILGANVAVNTTLAAASGGIVLFSLRLLEQRLFGREVKYDLAGACNGILAGLVAVCAGADVYTPGMAMLCGACGACACEIGHAVVLFLKIDDPLDAFAVHGCGGIIGVLLKPLIQTSGPDGHEFGIHIAACLCIIAWSGGISAIVFGALSKAKVLRVSMEVEINGADSKEMAQTFTRQASSLFKSGPKASGQSATGDTSAGAQQGSNSN